MELVVLDQNHKPIDALDAINLLATFEIYLIKTGVTVVSIVPLAPGPRPTSDQSGRSICIQLVKQLSKHSSSSYLREMHTQKL